MKHCSVVIDVSVSPGVKLLLLLMKCHQFDLQLVLHLLRLYYLNFEPILVPIRVSNFFLQLDNDLLERVHQLFLLIVLLDELALVACQFVDLLVHGGSFFLNFFYFLEHETHLCVFAIGYILDLACLLVQSFVVSLHSVCFYSAVLEL